MHIGIANVTTALDSAHRHKHKVIQAAKASCADGFDDVTISKLAWNVANHSCRVIIITCGHRAIILCLLL